MRTCLATGLILLATLASYSARTAPRPAYLLVINPLNPETEVDRRFLEGAFLKKITRWSNGEVIRPVELVSSSVARQRFSDAILNRSVDTVKVYWQQRIFSGRDVPPPEFRTDNEVIDYVLKYPGALGCVSPDAVLNGAKVLSVR